MKKTDNATYDVKIGETIKIQVTPKNFGASEPRVRAFLDPNKISPIPPTTERAPTYQFMVTKTVNSIHKFRAEFTFQPDAPAAAQYEVKISGESDEGCPCGFTIKKTTALKDPVIRFIVRA